LKTSLNPSHRQTDKQTDTDDDTTSSSKVTTSHTYC